MVTKLHSRIYGEDCSKDTVDSSENYDVRYFVS